MPTTTYVLSFDTEEDWCPQEDAVRTPNGLSRNSYLDSYEYVASGMLKRLATGLAERNVFATFYCTIGLVRQYTGLIKELDNMGHEIGVHVHMHNYPDLCTRGDELSSYTPRIQMAAIQKAKDDIERIVGHEVPSFRSGQWACDPGVEYVCARLGFESISNHESTYMLPSGLWQVATMKTYDILREPRMFWRSLKWDNGETLVPLFSHPMILFDHATHQPREKMLEGFFAELDEFRAQYPGIAFKTTTQAVSLLEYAPPSGVIRVAIGLACTVLLLSAMVLQAISATDRAMQSMGHNGDTDA